MRSFLFCTTYLDDNIINCHPLRYEKWISYYSEKMAALGVDYIFMIDDGSLNLSLKNTSIVHIHSAADELPAELSKKINIITFKKHLGRPTQDNYMGWWRSFTYSVKIAQKYGFEKIIHIESDFYIVSDRLTNYIQSLNKGWTSLFCSIGNYPETAIQIICQDNFHALEKVRSTAEASNYKMPRIAERYIPFTNVCKDFYGDRIMNEVIKQYMAGDNGINNLDYYGQLPTYVKPLSAPEFHKIIRSIGAAMMGDVPQENSMIEILKQHNLFINPS